MAMTVNGLNRTFKFRKGSETIVLADPMPGEMPDAVMNYYANMYPELTTATVHGPVIRERHGSVRVQDDHRNQRLGDMDKKKSKRKEKSCTPLKNINWNNSRGWPSARRNGISGMEWTGRKELRLRAGL